MTDDNSSTIAGIMYLLTLLSVIGVIIDVVIWASKKDDKFIDFHFKQLLVMWIAGIILGIISMIPILGWIVAVVGGIALFIFWIMGMIHAFKGEAIEVPFIGKYASLFKF